MKGLWDKIAVATPINTSAAVAVSESGIHYAAPEPNYPLFRWDACPSIKQRPPAETDITGLKRGKLTVVGLLDEPVRKNRNAVWVVRCVCGAYEARKAKALKNEANLHDECFGCRNLHRLRVRSSPSLKREART